MRDSLAQNRRALIFLALGLAVLLIYLATKVLGGGGAPPGFSSGSATSTTAPVAGPPGSAAPTTAAGSGTPVYTSKDPFKPLVNLNAGSSSGSVSTSGTGSSSGSGSGSASGGSTTTTTNGGGASSAGAAPVGSTSPTAGQRFEVLDIFASGQSVQASVQVDGLQYQVSPQQTFAGNYYVVDLSTTTQCGDFTHGGAPFHACRGQQVLK